MGKECKQKSAKECKWAPKSVKFPHKNCKQPLLPVNFGNSQTPWSKFWHSCAEKQDIEESGGKFCVGHTDDCEDLSMRQSFQASLVESCALRKKKPSSADLQGESAHLVHNAQHAWKLSRTISHPSSALQESRVLTGQQSLSFSFAMSMERYLLVRNQGHISREGPRQDTLDI